MNKIDTLDVGDLIRVNFNFPNPKWAGKVGKVIKIDKYDQGPSPVTVKMDEDDTELLFFSDEFYRFGVAI